ncbi:DUF305 domain-containing protein [Rhodococcus jostii]|uniref:DUF305 domain-containing protein n=1 Tax=Rhodococcus jostii TaxID=132919 RepID=UPI00362ED5E6
MPGVKMEGMMSADDMSALSDAQGVDATKLFLTQMTEHHTGAIIMARTEVADGQNAQAKAMAQNIITTQQQELTTMEQLLSTSRQYGVPALHSPTICSPRGRGVEGIS